MVAVNRTDARDEKTAQAINNLKDALGVSRDKFESLERDFIEAYNVVEKIFMSQDTLAQKQTEFKISLQKGMNELGLIMTEAKKTVLVNFFLLKQMILQCGVEKLSRVQCDSGCKSSPHRSLMQKIKDAQIQLATFYDDLSHDMYEDLNLLQDKTISWSNSLSMAFEKTEKMIRNHNENMGSMRDVMDATVEAGEETEKAFQEFSEQSKKHTEATIEWQKEIREFSARVMSGYKNNLDTQVCAIRRDN